MEVRHECDNPPCVRPDHLRLGLHLDNMGDMSRRGRARLPGLLGEAHPRSVLTEAQVRAIKARVGDTHKVLAAEFGVSRPTITAVRNGRLWKHLV